MRELLGGKGTISLLDCSAENAPNTDLYLYKENVNSKHTEVTQIRFLKFHNKIEEAYPCV
jgi:hypothetical protein